MRKYEISYKGLDNLQNELIELKEKVKDVDENHMFFRIYSEVMDREVIEAVCGKIEDVFPLVLYSGCTTSGNVIDGKRTTEAIVIICFVLEYETSRFKVFQFETREFDAVSMKKTMTDIYMANLWSKGAEVICTVTAQGTTEYFDEAMMYLSTKLTVFGGASLNRNIDVSQSWVFSKGAGISEVAALVTLMGGEDFHICEKTIIGWRPLGKDFKITKADKCMLYTLDDMPAFDVFSKYLKIENNDSFFMNAIEFPMLCRKKNGVEALRSGSISYEDGSVAFVSPVDSFDTARLTYGSQENIEMDAEKSAKEMKEFAPQIINGYSCAGRLTFLGDKCTIDYRYFAKLCGMTGFFSGGEYAVDENGDFIQHNETLVIVGFREGPCEIREKIDIGPEKKDIVSLNSRLVNFIGESTYELQEANVQLEKMVHEVEEKRKEAEHANMVKTDFLANMSHEIRTPINAIRGFNTMILRESKDERILKYSSDIHSASENLLAIINDILDLSKVEAGKMELIPVGYELSSVINDVMNMIQIKAEDKGLDVILKVDEDIPNYLYGDDVRLRQILVNLLNNAIKYTDKGYVSLNIKGCSNDNIERLHVEVTDTGRGIKDEDMGALFEKFRRIEENRNRLIEGTGLGMNITVGLLELMGSEIKVDSTYGKGSCFKFDLDQEIRGEEKIGNINNRIGNVKQITNYSIKFIAPKAHILLVDDNSLNRKVIISLLDKICRNIEEADGGYAALDKTREKHYDLILLDHMMPDLDGIEVFREIRSHADNPNVNVPIIMLTANAITGAKEGYIGTGFDAFLPKPVDPDKLEQMLETYLPEDKIIRGESLDEENYGDNDITIPEIEGIEKSYALDRLCSEKLVMSAMEMFVKGAALEAETLSTMKEQVKAHADRDDVAKYIHDYEVKVHSMKSSAAMIGGLTVSGLARALEYAAKKNETNTIIYVTDEFLDEWHNLAQNVKKAIYKTNESDMKAFDKEEFIILLDTLKNDMSLMDIDSADAVMDELRQYIVPKSIEADLDNLDGAVTNIDLDLLDEILLEIEGKI